MSETATKQYLDKDGLDALWGKMCETFPHKDALGNYLPLAGGAMTGPITSQSIIPAKTHTTSDTAYSLGSSTKQFNTTYTRYVDTVSGFNLRLRSGGVEHLNMISGNVNSTANIIPTATNTYNLGSSSYKWKNVYATTFIENGEYLSTTYANKTYADYCSSYLHNPNRAQFCKAAGVTVEYSTDSGTTWLDYGATDEQKIGFFSGISQNFYLGKKLSTKCLSSDLFRLTMDATTMGFYTSCKCLLINISTNGSSNFRVKVERSMKGSVDTFVTLIESQTLTGWSGWNRIPIGYSFGGGDTQTWNIAKLRLTFMSDGAGSSYTSGAHPCILDMEVLGTTYWAVPHTMAKTGHIYSWDTSGNAIFSKNITAPTFNGHLNGTISMTGGDGNNYRNILVTNGSNGICYSSAGNVQLNYATGDVKATSFTGKLIGNATSATKLSSTGIAFTPAETALTPDAVYTLLGGTTIKRGTWNYAGNGYISNDTTGVGAIDLAGTTVIQADGGSSTAYTQLYLTPSTGNTTGYKANEIFMYNNNGSGYSPSWTRVLTNRNYAEYCAPTSHTHSYLPLSGGTITGSLSIKRSPSAIQFSNSSGTALGYLGINADDDPVTYKADGSTMRHILHSGNYSTYALPKSGGTISSSSFCPLVIERSGSTNMAALRFKNSNGILGSIGMNAVYGSLLLHNADGTENKIILDSSNYSTYAATKDHVHSQYAQISDSFIIKRNVTDSLTTAQIVSYADLSTATSGQSDFKLLKSGSYPVQRSGSSELLINLGVNIGSTSAIEFLTNYTHTSRLKVRKIIDSNRVSGAFKELAWYSDIPTSLKNPYSLTIQGNGTTLTNGVYDGSAAKTVNITPDNIGAATASHTHTIVSTGNVVPALTGTLNNGVLEIKGLATNVSVTGITDPPGSNNSPESWFVDPTDMDALFT